MVNCTSPSTVNSNNPSKLTPSIHHQPQLSNIKHHATPNNPSNHHHHHHHLLAKLRSTLSLTISSLRSHSRSFLPTERHSFITDTTTSSRKKAIFSIALRKGLLVFFLVHTVISTSLTALALVRRGGSKIAKRSGASGPSSWHSSKKKLIQILVESFRSPSTARLATWLGLYSTLWTLTYSFLRKRQNGLSRWNAFIAGSLCGVSFFAQSKADRKELAPNVICRALYSCLMCYPLYHLKHADMLLFALSNAQIAIGYLLYPSTLPRWYVHWISRVGGLNPRYVDLNRQISRSLMSRSKANILKNHHQLLFQDTLPRPWKNETRIQNWLNSSNLPLRKNAPCALSHYRHESCLVSNFYLSMRTMVKMCPTYAILHLVPALIFRSKVLFNSPIKFITTIVKRAISSGLFLSTFCAVVQNCFCIPSKLYENYQITLPVVPVYGLLGFFTGISLLWEDPKRRGELALYCAPKALYSLWAVLKSKKIMPKIILGDILVCSIGSGILMHCFVHRKERMPALTRGIIGQLVDPHTPRLGKTSRGSLLMNNENTIKRGDLHGSSINDTTEILADRTSSFT